MMDSSTKRKDAPGSGSQGPHRKKSKGGNAGKWQTPHHKEKLEALRSKSRTLEVGDVGFWTTCQRHKEARALDELAALCEEYGEKVYGIKPEGDYEDDSGDEDGDIESAIQKEIDAMKPSSKSRRGDLVFDPMRLNLDCLLFVKTKTPVEPREFIRRICDDAKLVTDKNQRKARFINRFTPISAMGRATEQGVEEVAKTVLPEHFQLAGVDDKPLGEQTGDSYAIRFSSRAHNVLKRDDVIKQVAALIGPRHKVNLTTPDKVILIEVFQTFCGMSVVNGDWESMKRYNLNELYETALRAPKVPKDADAEDKPKEVASV